MKENKLDEIDRKILRALSHDGRISNQKLAELVNLSPTPCWNRVKALEIAGFIRLRSIGTTTKFSGASVMPWQSCRR